MKVLITGGAGFIGSHIAEALARQGMQVVVLDNLSPRVHGSDPAPQLPDNTTFINGDVRDKATWQLALQGVEIVFHQAAYQDYMPDYSHFFHTNVVGTALLYEVVSEMRLPVRKIVVASSQAVYGEGQYECREHGLILPSARSRQQMTKALWEPRCPACDSEMRPRLLQEHIPNPYNPYALSKYSQEISAIRLGQRIGVPTVALRYSIVQGPRQSPLNAYSGICRIFTTRLLDGRRPVIYEDGNQLRDYCHIDDVVAANLLVMDDDRANFDAFNVGSGQGITVREYARLLGEVIGREVDPLIPGKYRVGDNRHSLSSIAKLRALGWEPKKTLRDAIQEYWDWLQSCSVRQGPANSADSEMESSGVVCSVAAD